MPHPFGDLAVPSIEVGFDPSGAMWDKMPSRDDLYTPWNDLLNQPSPGSYSISPANTPTRQSPERTMSSRKSSPKGSSKSSPSAESEEERRKSRKREQNRESQRNFRRRQENRVKFLESRTLELEASSRQLRAENERLKGELHVANQRNDELFAMMSMPNTPLSMPLDFDDDQQLHHRHQDPSLPAYGQPMAPVPPLTGMPMTFELNEQHFYAPPRTALQDGAHASVW